jgi:transcriptional regulator with XRE-family HTH domain
VSGVTTTVNETGSNAFGEYLRARRETLVPEQLGLQRIGRRRVRGLRREEVAMAAAISTDYYMRLEQGRDRRPSEQVLDALARALRLDADEIRHLRGLAASADDPVLELTPADERVSSGLAILLDSWDRTPAFVLGRFLDVLALNPLARELLPVLEPGANLIEIACLDPRVPAMFGPRPRAIEGSVAALRASAGAEIDHPHVRALYDRLAPGNPLFAEIWARHQVRAKRPGIERIQHPELGELQLRYETLAANDADRQTLFVYYAEPGSAAADKLEQLADVAAGSRVR